MTRFSTENLNKALEALNLNNSKSIKKDELKTIYRKFSSIHHPDKGGDLQKMQQINWAYDFLCANFEKIFNDLNDQNGFNQNNLPNLSEEGKKVLEELQNLEGLNIDVVGCWIWVDGDTKLHKEALKTLGMLWNPKKLKWFWAGSETRSRSTMSYEKIKETHGSQSFRSKENKKLN